MKDINVNNQLKELEERSNTIEIPFQGHVKGLPGAYIVRTAGVHVIQSGACRFVYLEVVEKPSGIITIYDNIAGSGTEVLLIPVGMPKRVYPSLNLNLRYGLTVVTEKDCYLVIHSWPYE